MRSTTSSEQQALIDQLAESWKPREIRTMGGTLLRLADAMDQHWSGSNLQSIFRWPNALSRIEKNAFSLAVSAKDIYTRRRKRQKFIQAEFLGEPAWDMLLELFMQFAGGVKVSTTSLCIAADVPTSTALRHIAQLADAGMVKRTASEFDKRVTFVELTEKGILAVGCYLESY